MTDFILQEDSVSRVLLEDNSSLLLLETTPITDNSTISSKTTPSGIDIRSRVDTSTLTIKTRLSGIEVLLRDLATIESVTKPSGNESEKIVDRATITTYTSLVGSYLVETFIIRTRDYNFNPWNVPYSFDGSYHVSGNVGTFDDDTGQL